MAFTRFNYDKDRYERILHESTGRQLGRMSAYHTYLNRHLFTYMCLHTPSHTS